MIGLLLAAIIELTPGAAFVAPGGKLAHVEAVSTVAAGTVSVMSEVRIETNAVETVELAPVTNTIDTLTCSSGIGSKSPEDKWIAPGAKVWFTGTAKGPVWLYIEED